MKNILGWAKKHPALSFLFLTEILYILAGLLVALLPLFNNPTTQKEALTGTAIYILTDSLSAPIVRETWSAYENEYPYRKEKLKLYILKRDENPTQNMYDDGAIFISSNIAHTRNSLIQPQIPLRFIEDTFYIKNEPVWLEVGYKSSYSSPNNKFITFMKKKMHSKKSSIG